MLRNGIYEQVINQFIEKELLGINTQRIEINRIVMEESEAKMILAKYLAGVIEKGLTVIGEQGENSLQKQVSLCNELIEVLAQRLHPEDYSKFLVGNRAELLLALIDKRNTTIAMGVREAIIRPETSIAHSSLFTGALREPNLFGELRKEILSADRVDMLVSFIKWSGLRLLMDELKELTKTKKLRIITTVYMGATDPKAINELCSLPNTEIKISYDTKRTRLHAKTYVFYRDTGFTTAYIGSSNISNAALSSGLEWNIKVTAQDLPTTVRKIEATFESYWNDRDFSLYTETERPIMLQALKAEKWQGANGEPYYFDIRPYTFQKEILEKLDAERKIRGFTRNLVVAATGTGKTVVAALDYRRFCEENRGKHCRILFVAHREEILKQSIACFRMVMRDQNFGELFVGGVQPTSLDHLFVSVQTLHTRDLDENMDPDFYDYIVVDEFHRAAAPTYQRLLTYFNPGILLGLTATPERMDGQNILKYFGNRIAAEMRLPEAIERKLLSPFQYFGVSDNVDLQTVHWSRGGYDTTELTNVYTVNDHRAEVINHAVRRYVTDVATVKGLGFCVSIAHADFMARYFNRIGITSMALSADTKDSDREDAKRRLVAGEIRFIFVVDLYNEGVDIPEINTILFLRPTESLTVFLQQLGRGLRLFEGKECLTVLDFIGQAHKKYNFQDKFSSLLANTERISLKNEIQNGFLNAPRGCYIHLEKQAQKYILDNVKNAIRTKAGLINNIVLFESDSDKSLSMAAFLEYHHLIPQDIYPQYTFSRLSVWAGVKADFTDPDEDPLTKAMGRIATIDSRKWIRFLLGCLTEISIEDNTDLSEVETIMLRMFHYTLWQKPLTDCGFGNLNESLLRLKNQTILNEMIELLEYRLEKIDFVDEEIDFGFVCPLDLHCNYTRDQILAGLGYYSENKMPAMQEGVKFLADKKLDVFFITLNKTEKDYSDTTMYDDYSIDETLFHWQSQSTTSDNSPTGKRYIEHKKMGTQIILFVREYKKDRMGTVPYIYLGLAEYVSHIGSHPMNIIWRLAKPIPPKFYKKTNKLIVG